jgi:uncharacterized protein YfaA (DUF2138 family)
MGRGTRHRTLTHSCQQRTSRGMRVLVVAAQAAAVLVAAGQCARACWLRAAASSRITDVSWDISIMDLPADAQSVSDIPHDFAPAPLGQRAALIARI